MQSPDPFIHGGTPPRIDPYETLCRAYRATPDEVDVELGVEGELPRALRGVLYRNGPGRVEIGGDRYRHPFDGDGMVVRFELDGQRVRYRNRFVRTREWVEEERAGRMRYRAFGTNLPGGIAANLLRTRFKNAANTSVLWQGGRLWALWEGGLPHRLDPDTLETLGRDDLGGALRTEGFAAKLIGAEPALTAHPRRDPSTGELVAFGVRGAPTAAIDLYRFDDDMELVSSRELALPALPFVHDVAITQRYAVFLLAPVAFDVARMLVGLTTPVEALAARAAEPMEVLVVPRDGGEPRRLRARPGFVFHHVNAWEEGDTIVLWSLRMDGYEGGAVDLSSAEALRRSPSFGTAHLTRYVIDLTAGHVSEEQVCSDASELPTIDPRRVGSASRYAWALHRRRGDPGPLHPSLAKLDLEKREHVIRDLAPDIPSEPVFVPAGRGAADDEGWALTLVYLSREHRSELHVLDAATLAPIARARLPHHVPPGFHGTWRALD